MVGSKVALRLSCRDDADAFDRDALDRGAAFLAGAGDRGEAFKDVVTGAEFAESGVLLIEEAGVAVADEKLTASRVGMSGTSHRDDTADVGFGVEFGFNLVTRTARARHAAAADFGVGATALNHETFDDAVKRGAVIEALASKFLEIFNGLRRDVGPEGEGDFAIGGLDDRSFVSVGGCTHKAGNKACETISRKQISAIAQRLAN